MLKMSRFLSGFNLSLEYYNPWSIPALEDEYGKAKRGLRRRKNVCEGKEEGPPRKQNIIQD